MRPLSSSILTLSLLALPAIAQQPACPAVSHINMQSGTFSSQPGVSFTLHHFAATLIPMGKTSPTCFQKLTVVSHADIFVSSESLTAIFTNKLAATPTKIKDLKVENDAGIGRLTGSITKVIPIRFLIEGPVTTDGHVIRLEATKIHADGIPISAMLQLVGEHLSAMLLLKGVKGIIVQDNTLSFDPQEVAHLKGHIGSVTTTPQGLTLHYTAAPPPPRQMAHR